MNSEIDRRMAQAHAYLEKNPDACWYALVAWAYASEEGPEVLPATTNSDHCKEESIENGMCYCGTYIKGEMQ